MNKHFLNFLKFILFLGVGLSILYFVFQRYDAAYMDQCELDGIPMDECSLVQKVIDDFKSANFFWIFVVLIAFTVSNISRALRWNMLIKPLGYSPRLANSFFTIIIGYFANLGLPRVGEVVRAATMSKYEKIPVEKLMGTIVVGRLMDVICLLLAIGLAFVLEFDTLVNYITESREAAQTPEDVVATSNTIYWIIGSVFLVGAVLIFVFRKALIKTKLYQKVVGFVKGLWEGVQTVRKMKNPWVFIFHSLNIWVMYFLMTYLCFFAFEPTSVLPPIAALMAFVFGAFGIVIPSPGGMGTYHFFTSEALMIYGLPGGDAFSFANILFFSIQIGCNVLIGILSLILLPLINRGYEPKPQNIVQESAEKITI